MLKGKTSLLAVTCLLFEENHLKHLDNCLLLGYCWGYWQSFTDASAQPIGPILKG
jgi:hypothetical protein